VNRQQQMGPQLEQARAAFQRRAWASAQQQLAAVDQVAPLSPEDLELLAWSAALIGRDEEHLRAMERLYQAHLDAGAEERAARAAFWVGQRLLTRGEPARAGGWYARAQRLVEGRDCVEWGYLRLPLVYRNMHGGDLTAARVAAQEAAAIADRFHEVNLSAFARCLEGCALLRLGQVEAGLPLVDEAMVAVTTGQLAPLLSGFIYCSAIAGCSQAYVVDRSREWTAALADWCDAQPELVLFNAQCLIHRSELMQLAGDWQQSVEEARRATERVSQAAAVEAAGDSLYQQAEVLRLRGDWEGAERVYREATQKGREAQPGMALLRLAQGRTVDAVSALRRVLQATSPTQARLKRARFLPAFVEICLAVGELDEAERGCVELEGIARDVGTDVLRAMAAHARGAVELACGRPEAALEPLRHAFRVWNEVGAPYIAARLRVLLARACRALGDADTAALETDLAREVFQKLGALPDLANLDGVVHHPPPAAIDGAVDRRSTPAPPLPDGLTAREVEVLRLVAAGLTNKVIARKLFLSEKTIDRHLSNIFAKIDVASRAAATAYAYQRGLVEVT